MLRRQTRLRREYLYRKSLEGKEKEEYEKKRLLRQALQEGKPIPTELRAEEQQLRKEIELEDDNTGVQRTHVDDEYRNAGAREPKILLTTSRDPSSRLKAFAKELKLVFPNAQRMNRGKFFIFFFKFEFLLLVTDRDHQVTRLFLKWFKLLGRMTSRTS